jgi:hypothetical protein
MNTTDLSKQLDAATEKAVQELSRDAQGSASQAPRSYRDIVELSGRTPTPVFSMYGLCFLLEFPLTDQRKKVRTMARAHYGCVTCTNRADKYVRFCCPGADGKPKPAFLSMDLSQADKQIFRDLRAFAVETCRGSPTVVLTTPDMFLPSQEGMGYDGSPFFHWTCGTPTHCTDPQSPEYLRFQTLKPYMQFIGTRVQQLLAPEATPSVKLMVAVLPRLERGDHWRSVLRWVQGLQTELATTYGGRAFDHLSDSEKAFMYVHALMTGRCEGPVHLDYKQAQNILDFLMFPSQDALIAEMDHRSDPAFYQRSALIRRLDKEGVTATHTISLTWGGSMGFPGLYPDDLDIHVLTPGGIEIYYGMKKCDGCTLDFDANISGGEAEPCENVSVRPGTFVIMVNNFTRRTVGPIPFEITCRQVGKPDVVYPGVWPADRRKDDKVTVCTHTFDADDSATGPAQMTGKSAGRTKAQDPDWQQRIGDLTCYLATLEDVQTHPGVKVTVIGEQVTGPVDPEVAGSAVSQSFLAMAGQAKDRAKADRAKDDRANADPTKAGKRYLSEACRSNPATIQDLVTLMEGGGHSLTIVPRDYIPGYLTKIQPTGSDPDVVMRCGGLAQCTYLKKYELPVQPVAGKPSTARFDESWFKPSDGAAPRSLGNVMVKAIVKIGPYYFFTLPDTKLPESQDFPLAGGFYPTDLRPDFHQHRERWTYFHSQLKPGVGAQGTPMIGTFLTSPEVVVYLDGVKLTISTAPEVSVA